ncbi:hypothetical protein HDU98_005710, partial [Podochytrium sp. JEL0797]
LLRFVSLPAPPIVFPTLLPNVLQPPTSLSQKPLPLPQSLLLPLPPLNRPLEAPLN